MVEQTIGIIENVQAKGKSTLTKKTCSLLITSKRIICIPLSGSTFVAGMIGHTIAGPSGAIAFSQEKINQANQKLKEISSSDLDEILLKETDSFEIKKEEIQKGIMKTGFFSTLGIWIPLTIYTDKRFYFDIPIGEKENAKSLISNFNNKIIIK